MVTFQVVSRLIHVDALVCILDLPRPKGFYFPGESHDFWEGVFVYEGEVTATADERVYRLGVGKFLLHKPMEFHRIWAAKDCAPRLINISFRATGELLQRLNNDCFDLNAAQQKQFWQIASAFFRVMDLQDAGDAYPYQLAKNLTASLLESFLIGLTEDTTYISRAQSKNEEQYYNMVQVMKANCHQTLSLSELSALCQTSVSNLKRIFALYCDIGIAKYFLALKMRRAMELLDQGWHANRVAEALSYSDVSYFYTVFKRETGMTPVEYRNLHQNPSLKNKAIMALEEK